MVHSATQITSCKLLRWVDAIEGGRRSMGPTCSHFHLSLLCTQWIFCAVWLSFRRNHQIRVHQDRCECQPGTAGVHYKPRNDTSQVRGWGVMWSAVTFPPWSDIGSTFNWCMFVFLAFVNDLSPHTIIWYQVQISETRNSTASVGTLYKPIV